MIFFNLVQILETSKLWSESISADQLSSTGTNLLKKKIIVNLQRIWFCDKSTRFKRLFLHKCI